MPTYEYGCKKCGHVFEVQQSFSDAPVTRCTQCSGRVRRLFSPPAIIFKGKGFHCTDYGKRGRRDGDKPSETTSEDIKDSAKKKADDVQEKTAAS